MFAREAQISGVSLPFPDAHSWKTIGSLYSAAASFSDDMPAPN
jgi:hypothetical protein